MTFAATRSKPQHQFPGIPEPYASVRCDSCSFVWKDGSMRIKFISANCGTHSRYLEGDR